MARRLLARLNIREESFLRRSQASNSFQEEEHFSLVQHVICGSHKSRTLRGARGREDADESFPSIFGRRKDYGLWNGKVGAEEEGARDGERQDPPEDATKSPDAR